MANYTPEVIKIPLSQQGKYAGMYEAIVSPDDKELAGLKWSVAKIIDSDLKYVLRRVRTDDGKKKAIYLHREILERMLGRKLVKGEMVDHKDGNPLNNTRDNLRLATYTQNNRNRGKNANNKSGYKGVTWHKQGQKWQAQIKMNGENIYLGLFDTPELANKACCEERNKLHGEFANHS